MGNRRGRKPKKSIKLYRRNQLRIATDGKKQRSQQTSDAYNAGHPAGQCQNITTVTGTNHVAQSAINAAAKISNVQCQNITTVTSTNSVAQSAIDATAKTSNMQLQNFYTLKDSDSQKFGRRVINVSQFFDQLKEISSHGPLNCGLESIELVSEARTGLISQFKLLCKMCNLIFCIYSDNPLNELDVNTAAVAGTVATGCGYSQLEEISAAIGLVPMNNAIFSSKLEIVHKKWESELMKSMSEAGIEERRLAIEDSKVNADGIAIIDVIADGCYAKRSYRKNYSSLSGAAAIIGKRTNKILFLAIKNKYCCICAVAQTKGEEPKDHICYKNYSGASTGMESEILTEGFKRSLEMHNVIYGRLISDGDANTYSKILESRPYENYTVEKVECRNHLLRNTCTRLGAISTDTRYILKYRKYVTTKRILATRKVIVKAIKNYKNSNNITDLYHDIVTAPDHAFGRHGKCKAYFCSQADDENVDTQLFSNSMWQRIKLIITQLAAHARSLILDVETNSVERYHCIVAKFVGGKRINFSRRFQYQMRCNAAALSFNCQNPLSILHKSLIGRDPCNEIKKCEKRRLNKRQLTQKYLRKKKRFNTLESQDTRNYGIDCTKPDMELEMLEKSKKNFLESLEKSSEERRRIAKETVLQSGCSEWLELRRNILTASNFGRVIKRRMDISCQNMVKDILYKKSIEHVESIKHGRDSEKVALEQLSHQENVKINPCGLYIDPDVPYLGATPDGIIKEDTIVEIKCPKSVYNIGVDKAVSEKKISFYKKNKDGLIEVNKNHYWYFQIQGQLHVTRKENCLFGIWSGQQFPVKTEIIYRDDEFWSNIMEKKLKDFYLDCLLPELVDPRHTRKLPIRDPIYVVDAIQRKNSKRETKPAPKKRKMDFKMDQPSTITTQSASKRRKAVQEI